MARSVFAAALAAAFLGGGFALARSVGETPTVDLSSLGPTLAGRGEFLPSGELIHALVLGADQASGPILATTSTGVECRGVFEVVEPDGRAGQLRVRCDDGRAGDGSYALDIGSGVNRSVSGFGCIRMSVDGVADRWVARLVFGDLAFAPGYPAGLDCGTSPR